MTESLGAGCRPDQSRPPTPFNYVLIADADPDRTSRSAAEATTTFGAGAVIARDTDDALELTRRFGPPALLIVDLSLPEHHAFTLIERISQGGNRRPRVIAWCATRELREFAASRLAGFDVKLLKSDASPIVLRNAIGWARRDASNPLEHVRARISSVAETARRAFGAAGAAVYMRSAGDTDYRASITWASDSPMPEAPIVLPQIFDAVLNTGRPMSGPDAAVLQPHAGMRVSELLRGVAAAPVVSDGMTVGALVLFDVKPLELSEQGLEKLQALCRFDSDARTIESASRARVEQSHPGGVLLRLADRRNVDRPVPLTDRTSAASAIQREIARARRRRAPLSVIMFGVTSTNADSAQPIAAVMDTLVSAMRASDLAVQWSSDRLLIVLSDLGESAAQHVAERLRTAVHGGAQHHPPVAGVAELADDDTFDAVLLRASESLQRARSLDHDRIA